MGFSRLGDVAAAVALGRRDTFDFVKLPANTFGGVGQSLWALTGNPGQGGYGSVALAAVQHSAAASSVGAITFPNTPAGMTRHLTSFGAARGVTSTAIGYAFLFDRLLSYPAIPVTTTLQAFTNPVSLPRYTDGIGVMAMLEIQEVFGGSGSLTVTVTYLNQDGVSRTVTQERTLSIVNAGFRNNITGLWYVPLLGDLGIKSAVSITSNVINVGKLCLVLVKPLAVIQTVFANYNERDTIVQVPQLERIYDDACLFVSILDSVATDAPIIGRIETVYK